MGGEVQSDDGVRVVDERDFGVRVRRLREERGWSQGQLAAAAGIGQSQVSKIEAGDQAARLPTAMRLASAFGVSLDALAGYRPGDVPTPAMRGEDELDDLQVAHELQRLVRRIRRRHDPHWNGHSNTDSNNLKAASLALLGIAR